MKYTFLDSERTGEVELKDAIWMCFEGTQTDKVYYWGVGQGNQWQSKPAFNAWWNTVVLQKYSHPLSAPGLHILTGKDAGAVKDDNIGVVHQDYAGGLVDKSDWNPVVGWCQVGVLGGAMYSRRILGDPKKEKERKVVTPWPRVRSLIATVASTFFEGATNYIVVADLQNYVADRLEDWDKSLPEKRVCQINAIEDVNDYWGVFAPIEAQARESALAGKKNGKSRRTTPLMVLTNKGGDTPVDMMEMPKRRYKVHDDAHLKKGIPPILWDGTRVAIANIQAVIDNSWRIGV